MFFMLPLKEHEAQYSRSSQLTGDLLLICQAVQQMNAQNHHQQTNGHDDKQCKSEPTQHHRAGANTTSHTAVAKVLSDLRGCHRCCMLPQDRYENKDRGNEDKSESDLRDGS